MMRRALGRSHEGAGTVDIAHVVNTIPIANADKTHQEKTHHDEAEEQSSNRWYESIINSQNEDKNGARKYEESQKNRDRAGTEEDSDEDVLEEEDPKHEEAGNSWSRKPFVVEDAVKELWKDQAEDVLASIPASCKGKERVVWFYIVTGTEIPKGLCEKLPTWEQVAKVYGDEPVIKQECGLEEEDSSTNQLVSKLRPDQPRAAKISGLPNVGTDMLKQLLRWNIEGFSYETHPKSTQTPLESLFRHMLWWLIPTSPREDHLRIVLTKDLYFWMHSLCLDKPSFVSFGRHLRSRDGCPRSPKRLENGGIVPSQVSVLSSDHSGHEVTDEFPSLVHYWSKWVAGFIREEEPDDGESTQYRIVIRFEDLLFHPETVLRAVARCSRTKVPDKFTYRHNLSPAQRQNFRQNPTSQELDRFVEVALPFYANAQLRKSGLEQADLEHIERNVDKDLLQSLHYYV